MNSRKTPKRIKEKQLVRIFQDFKRLACRENCFCFLLGAGASKSSGIPTGNELCQKWYEELKEDLREEPDLVKDWENKVGVALNLEHAGQFYPFLYTKRYENSPHLGYEELKSLMDKKEPSIGYLILAQILAEGVHRFVVTTNFDALIEDAIRMHTAKRPLVAGHETLAEYISLQDERPTIIKIHRDLLLHPFNDEARTSFLQEEWKKALSPLLKNFCMLVVGYGGNDGSLMDYLKAIDPSDRKSIYWCIRKESDLSPKVSDLLTEKDYVVEIEGFDELMFALNDTLKFNIFDNLDQPEQHPFVTAAMERVKAVAEKRKEILEKLSQRNGEKVSSAVKTMMKGAAAYIFKAYLQKENGKKEQIYLEGLKKYPESVELLTAYADWLDDMQRYPEALEIYEKAEQIAALDGSMYNNWGVALNHWAGMKGAEEAERLYQQVIKKYQKAIELQPGYARAYNNWGLALKKLADRKEGIERKKLYEEAIEKYQRAIENDSNNADAYNNWGNVLQDLANNDKAEKEAEKLYQQAVEKYQKAIEFNPNCTEAYDGWGKVLRYRAETEGRKTEKEKLYQQAMEKFLKEVELGGECYNLACLYALLKNKKSALQYLEQSLNKKEESIDFVFQDEDWNDFLQDPEFLKVIEKYKSQSEV